jgi:glyoxylase-like metal-dependent hydrolase (beta-lactamase superfamily II)
LADGAVEIAKGVFKLQFDIPYNVQPVNIYLLAGNPTTLIDTGPLMEGVEERVVELLLEAGADPAGLERIVLTHHHPDHIGLAASFKEKSGAEVVCHHHSLPMVQDYVNESRRLVRYLVERATYMGLDRDLFEEAINRTNRWYEVAEPVVVDTTVGHGDVIKGDPLSLEVVHTPGHCIDHICLHERNTGFLFSGDMLLFSITPNPDIYPPWQSDAESGLPHYMESLERLKGLEVTLAMPGHGKNVSDFAGRVDEVIRHHRERADYIHGVVRDRPRTVLEVALELIGFIDAEPTSQNIFLAIREVFGHLVILENEGRAGRESKEGVALFSSF